MTKLIPTLQRQEQMKIEDLIPKYVDIIVNTSASDSAILQSLSFSIKVRLKLPKISEAKDIFAQMQKYVEDNNKSGLMEIFKNGILGVFIDDNYTELNEETFIVDHPMLNVITKNEYISLLIAVSRADIL